MVVALAENISIERMVRAVDKVRERLLRSTSALESAGVPYAVIGGNAVMSWVSSVDESAIRYTKDVDILLRRGDLPAAIEAMKPAGFTFRHVAHVDMFLDGPKGKALDAVHVLFAGEKVREEYVLPTPDVSESQRSAEKYQVLTLEALVRMKLTSYRIHDQTHILDMIRVGLLNADWPQRFPPKLAGRLQRLIDNPEGHPGDD